MVKMKKYLKLDTVIALILIIFSLVFLNMTREFPEESALFPKLTLYSMILFSVMVIIESVVKNKKIAGLEKESIKNIFIITVLIVLYYVLAKFLGLIIATFFFILATTKFLGEESIAKSVILGIGLNILIYVVFVKFLSVPIPYKPIFL